MSFAIAIISWGGYLLLSLLVLFGAPCYRTGEGEREREAKWIKIKIKITLHDGWTDR